MGCHNQPKTSSELHDKKILLMGNPNVGKSVIFSRLTGLDVIASNYTGTTVSYNQGTLRYNQQKASLIDVPGIYSLDATSKAEEVAIDMLNEGADLIVCVLDATHLERNLHLALTLKQYNLPIVYALNLNDVALRRGIKIDTNLLSKYLDAPVIETVAVKKEGIAELKDEVFKSHSCVEIQSIENINEKAEEIAENVTKTFDVKVSMLERIGDWAIHPLSGIPIAILVLGVAIALVVGGGAFLRGFLLLPLLDNFYIPFITGLINLTPIDGVFYQILVGEYGALIKIIEWPFALILPYVFLFYIVFSFLEDSGYLPRLGVLMDSLFKRLGLPGSNIVPFIMGYGCAVPAILGTRASSSKKERIIVVSMISIAVPCTAQTSAFIVLLGGSSVLALLFVFFISFLFIVLTGLLLNKLLKGKTRPMILEIPNLLMPDVRSLLKKIWVKLKHYLKDAQGPMFVGIIIAALLVETNALLYIGNALQPVVVGWLDLPQEASLALMLGVIRRELAVVPLLGMDLTTVQLITGAVVALFYLPCFSAFIVLVKEFKVRIAVTIGLSTFVLAFLMGGIVQHVLNFLIS